MTGYLHLDHINMENMLLLNPDEDREIEGYDMPSRVEVSFIVPQCGPIKETYDMFNAGDLASWKTNMRLYPQSSAKALQFVKLSRRRWHVRNEAKREGDRIANEIRASMEKDRRRA